jgi:lipoprotein-releasing system permease protein
MNTFMPFEWIAALRFLREGRMQSLFIISGVAIGVGVIVFMSALLGGMQANIFNRMLSSQPHITMERPKQVATPLHQPNQGEAVIATIQKPSQRMSSLDQWQKLRDQLQIRADIVAVSPTASGPAFVVRGDATQSISLIGIDPDQYIKVVPLPEKMIAGTFRMANSDMIVGAQFAEDLDVKLGDKLRVATVTGGSLTLNIVGIFDLGSRGVNQRNVYVLLSTAQNLLQLIGGVSSIELTVTNPYAAETIAQSIAAQTGLQALSWIAANNQFFFAINAQTFSSLLIRIFVGLSVAAGIGGSRGQIMRVFLIQGAIVGLLGSLVGSALGALLLSIWRTAAKNPDGTPMFVITLDPALFAWSALIATITGVLAAATPAIRASRLDPVVAMRG